jgi:DNA-nicking Smr family endonuclease
VKALKDLQSLHAALVEAEREKAAEAARAAAEAERAAALQQQFARAVGEVKPLKSAVGPPLPRPKPAPVPLQRLLDERVALQEALSDEVDVESLLLTDDGLSFRRPGIGLEVLSKLRSGRWALQAQLDLHGLRRDAARERLAEFIRASHRQGLRCVRIVHGKGHGSPGKEPVLKAKVQRWLAQRPEVIAFAQAAGPQGGAGALIVLLQMSRPVPGADETAPSPHHGR